MIDNGKSLRDSKLARWTALGIVSFTMMAAYFFYDAMAPLKRMLEETQGWSSSDYGTFTSAYGWFNVFLLMLFFGGLLLDKKGIRFTGVTATGLMVLGAFIKYAALSGILPTDGVLFGLRYQVLFASVGYAVFGIGSEVAGVVVSRVIVKWFKGYEMALAMGLQVAVARIGTGIAMLTANPLARYFNDVSGLLLFGVTLLAAGLLSFLMYNIAMDRRIDRQTGNTTPSSGSEEEFKLSDVKIVATNYGFWLIALLCMLFYSCIFPFLKYAPDLMINKFGIDEEWAGVVPSLLPIGTVILTPLFGYIYDHKGKGATIMLVGVLMLIGVHALFSLQGINNWVYAAILMMALGVAFSLVPSAMWPSIPKIIPEKQLGTAYALIFWVQNFGLWGIPLLIGQVLDKFCKTVSPSGNISYDYTLPMLIFLGLAVLSAVFALLLRREDRRKGYGLEYPNIERQKNTPL
ncbi:MAG: MFS transporter [Bacteroidales bacterium]|jgi:MFS family permease|nr:MFS transporter [Bacteroidales bacterium]